MMNEFGLNNDRARRHDTLGLGVLDHHHALRKGLSARAGHPLAVTKEGVRRVDLVRIALDFPEARLEIILRNGSHVGKLFTTEAAQGVAAG